MGNSYGSTEENGKGGKGFPLPPVREL